MRLHRTRLSALACSFLLLASFSPLASAQEGAAPGFDAPDSPAPGFQANASAIASFDWDAVSIQNAHLSLSDQATRDTLQRNHGLSLSASSDLIVYQGRFTRKAPTAPQLLVIDTERDELRLYEGTSVIARHKELGLVSAKEATRLGLPQPAFVAQLVSDGTMQLVLWRKRADASRDKARYNMTVYKVIGSYFGTPFDQEVAATRGEDAIVPTSTVTFFQGDHHLVIGVTPLDKSGEPIEAQQQLMRWDRWSGTFSNPEPPPTAPTRKNTRS